MGIEGSSQVHQSLLDFSDQFRPTDNRAGYNVGVAVEVLGTAVQRKIKAQLQREKIHRGGEGVVNHRYQRVGPGKLHDFREIPDFQQGIGQAFHEDGPRIRLQLVPPGIGLKAIDEVNGDSKGREILTHKPMGSSVESRLGQQVIA